MDSIKTYLVRKVKQKIQEEENQNDNFEECRANAERVKLALCFFEMVQNIKISPKAKEKAIMLFDLVPKTENFGLEYQQIFLLSILHTSLKLEEPPDIVLNKITQLIEFINNIHVLNNNKDESEFGNFLPISISIKELNMAEIFMLNKLEWKFNIVLISDFVNFFLENHLQNIYNYIELQSLQLFINFFLECALSAFFSQLIPQHSVGIGVIILAIDQFRKLDTYTNSIQPLILQFLEVCKTKYKIDLIRVENYKKLLIDFTDVIEVKIVKEYPDSNIKALTEKFTNDNLIKYINDNSNHESFKLQFYNQNYRSCEINCNYRNKLNISSNSKDIDNHQSNLVDISNNSFSYLSKKEFKEDNIMTNSSSKSNSGDKKTVLKKFKSLNLNANKNLFVTKFKEDL
jgi:hypothetical protein